MIYWRICPKQRSQTLLVSRRAEPLWSTPTTFETGCQQGQVLILNDAYIYKNILASGTADDAGRSYGASPYYGRKVIFKTRANAVHVLTIPTDTETADPQPRNFFGFEKSLQATDLLHCDMYDDALFPIALADSYVIQIEAESTRTADR